MTDNRMQRNAKPQYTSYDMREESTMTDNNTNSKMRKHIQTQAGSAMQQTYEASVGARALERAGSCPQLKGIAHEIMFCDKVNLNPKNILDGTRAALTKSNTAQMRDIILTKGGKIAGHAQLKDTISNSGIRKTAGQILKGKYSKTSVYGTEETAAKVTGILDKAGSSHQTIHSTGISSKTTSRIADKALGKMPTSSALGAAAKSGGAVGAAVGAGVEAVSSLYDVYKGDKDVEDAVIDIAGAGIKGGITGAASSTAASVAAGATGVAIEAATGTAIGGAIATTTAGGLLVAAAPVAVGLAAAYAVGSFFSSLFDD